MSVEPTKPLCLPCFLAVTYDLPDLHAECVGRTYPGRCACPCQEKQ